MLSLPEKFLFFKPEKYQNNAIRVAEVTTTAAGDPKNYTVAYTPTEETYVLTCPIGIGTTVGTFKLNGVGKRMYDYGVMAVTSAGYNVRVFSFSNPSDVFGKYVLQCKKVVSVGPIPVDPIIQHIEPPPANLKKVFKKISVPSIPASPPAPLPPTPKPVASVKNKGAGDLGLFVAKQLLEFAQSKYEMCPITAEEFITGNTAVMPCGHLFMQFAIEETFKKEPNRCPSCRQSGRPTYV
jgi:hypothetical protein